MRDYYKGPTPPYVPPDKDVLRDQASRRAKRTAEPGPAERMYGQDRMINQETAQPGERSVPGEHELTPAQRDMRAKREKSRANDRAVARGDKEPELSYPELKNRSSGPER